MDKVFAVGAETLKGTTDKIRLRLQRTYKTYIKRLVGRHSKSKSFFVRTEPIPLYDFFVPMDLKSDRRLLKSPGAADLAAISPRTILVGSGGCGKTMVMRHLLLSALQGRGKTPVFLELRQLGGDEPLLAALLASMKNNGLDVDEAYFQQALSLGHFLVVLDGLDELDSQTKPRITKEIQSIGERYPDNWIIVSSRPEPELEGWPAFSLFRVAPLDLEKAVALVERLPFDDEIKSKFANDLKSRLFRNHKSFLSNPLLLSIMVLTYHDTASIPGKLSIFYSQAYESLFQKHDALKGGYQRQRKTQLDIQDFAKVFAAFSARTYDRRLLKFSSTVALDVLDRCKLQTSLPFEPGSFLDDARRAVCLLVEEGIDLAFAHRSFQEYFTARFISEQPATTKGKLIERFGALDGGSESVIPLLFEMDPFSVEEHYILPAIESLRVKTGFVPPMNDAKYLAMIRYLFSQFNVSEDPQSLGVVAGVNDWKFLNAIRFAYSKFGRAIVRPDTRIGKALRSLVGSEGSLKSVDIVEGSEFANALAASEGGWGKVFFEGLLLIENDIRKRHADPDRSLDLILG